MIHPRYAPLLVVIGEVHPQKLTRAKLRGSGRGCLKLIPGFSAVLVCVARTSVRYSYIVPVLCGFLVDTATGNPNSDQLSPGLERQCNPHGRRSSVHVVERILVIVKARLLEMGIALVLPQSRTELSTNPRLVLCMSSRFC